MVVYAGRHVRLRVWCGGQWWTVQSWKWPAAQCSAAVLPSTTWMSQCVLPWANNEAWTSDVSRHTNPTPRVATCGASPSGGCRRARPLSLCLPHCGRVWPPSTTQPRRSQKQQRQRPRLGIGFASLSTPTSEQVARHADSRSFCQAATLDVRHRHCSLRSDLTPPLAIFTSHQPFSTPSSWLLL